MNDLRAGPWAGQGWDRAECQAQAAGGGKATRLAAGSEKGNAGESETAAQCGGAQGLGRIWGAKGFQSCCWKILRVFREEELSMAEAEGGAELGGVWTQ